MALADGFAASLHEELDYQVEVANMRGVAAASDLVVPRAHEELSSERVIVMERIAGQPLSSAGEALDAMSDAARAQLADDLLTGVLRQIFVGGVFHADLHPGNVILTDDGRVALLDFGSVGRLDRTARGALVMLLSAVQRQDSIAATDSLITRYGDGIAPGGTGAMFTELLDLVVRHGFRVPPQLAAVFRTLGALDGTLRLIDPRWAIWATAASSPTSATSSTSPSWASRSAWVACSC